MSMTKQVELTKIIIDTFLEESGINRIIEMGNRKRGTYR